jgi:hypothetical protein
VREVGPHALAVTLSEMVLFNERRPSLSTDKRDDKQWKDVVKREHKRAGIQHDCGMKRRAAANHGLRNPRAHDSAPSDAKASQTKLPCPLSCST